MKDYILIKLRSGEEIIASTISKNRNGMRVFRPMQIRQVPYVDHGKGVIRAAVVLENWIGRTNENEIVIPNSWIGIKMPPSTEVIEAYERSLKSEDSPKKEEPKVEVPTISEKDEEELKRIEDEMMNMMKEIAADAGITPPSVEGLDAFSNEMGKQNGKDVVVVNFVFPTKIFKNMIEEGILEDFLAGPVYQDENGDDSEEDLEDDVDMPPRKIKTKSDDAGGVRDGEGSETFGNSFKDWSPDPKDYL